MYEDWYLETDSRLRRLKLKAWMDWMHYQFWVREIEHYVKSKTAD